MKGIAVAGHGLISGRVTVPEGHDGVGGRPASVPAGKRGRRRWPGGPTAGKRLPSVPVSAARCAAAAAGRCGSSRRGACTTCTSGGSGPSPR